MGTRSAVTQLDISISSAIKNTLTDGQVSSATVGKTWLDLELANGVSANESNRAWEDRGRTISSGATEDIDLYDLGSIDVGAGAGADALGQALSFEEITVLMIKQTGGDGSLEIQPSGATNPVTWIPANTATVANGGALRTGHVYLRVAPDEAAFNVTDASSHILRLGANGDDVTYDIMIVGRHDDNESSSSSSSSASSQSSSLSTTSESSQSSSCST